MAGNFGNNNSLNESMTIGPKYYLTPADHAILSSYIPVVDGIASLFGNSCEVVLHSLEELNQSVFHIANGQITGRKAGSPITDFAFRKLHELTVNKNGFSECYYSRLQNGTILRSVTIVIKNDQKVTIGLLCININISTPMYKFMKTLMPDKEIGDAGTTENYPATIDELVDDLINSTVMEINSELSLSNKMKNRCIVRKLAHNGVFDLKDAVQSVAEKLCISKHTVYYYLREMKDDDTTNGEC